MRALRLREAAQGDIESSFECAAVEPPLNKTGLLSPLALRIYHEAPQQNATPLAHELAVLPVKNERARAHSPALRHRIPMATLRQHARLSIGVGGIGGGMMLLAANSMSILAGGSSSFVPLLANAALVFGGVMFLRERRKATRPESEEASRSLAAG